MGKIEEKSFEFAVEIVRAMRIVQGESKEYDLSRQLIRCGTSIGANVSEAQKAQSDRDFMSKLSIASKEAEEARYWIKLMIATELLSKESGTELIAQSEELIRMLTAAIKTLNAKELNT